MDNVTDRHTNYIFYKHILNVVSGKQSEASLDILVVFAAEKYS